MGTKTASRKWAYTWNAPRTRYLHKFYTAQDWERANLARQIKDLDERIASGRSWLKTIATTDPRYPRWSCKLAELRLKRDRLAGTTKMVNDVQ